MTSKILNNFNFNDYKSFCNYFSTIYNKGILWIRSNCCQSYSRLSGISILARLHMRSSLNAANFFLWSHKELIIGGTASATIGVVLLATDFFNKMKPQSVIAKSDSKTEKLTVIKKSIVKAQENKVENISPIITMKTTLNFAELTVEIPKTKPLPPKNVTLTFCIDISGSMQGERQNAVVKAMSQVLDNAQKVIDGLKATKIKVAIITFREFSEVMVPSTILTPTEEGVNKIEMIKNKLGKFTSYGQTNLIQGLTKATSELENMAKIDKTSSHTFILLTDGEEQNLNRLNEIPAFHAKLIALQAKLFVIGIGEKHNKEILKKIAGDNNNVGFRGTYIDTTLNQNTIERTISKIYTQTMASFRDFTLKTSSLKLDTWSVSDSLKCLDSGQVEYKLGSLVEDKGFVKYIQIHPDKLSVPLDLSQVIFKLTFIDSEEKTNEFLLAWNPNTIIDNKIIAAAQPQLTRFLAE